MKPENVSTQQAKQDKLFYVVANTIVYRESDGRCLILKRDMREKVHPGKWATVGGKLEHADLAAPTRKEGDVFVFEDAVYTLLEREVLEEAGVNVSQPPKFLGSKVIVRGDGIPVVLLFFASKYKGGEVKPEAGSFTDFAWVNEQEIGGYDCIEDVAKEVKTTIKIFQEAENG